MAAEAVASTIAQVEDLAGLGDRLERRNAARRVLSGTVLVRSERSGRNAWTAALVDLSRAGLTCGGVTLDMRGEAVRHATGPTGPELAVRFLDLDAQQRANLGRLLG